MVEENKKAIETDRVVRAVALRAAGAVRRCHTIRYMIGSYDVAQHSWNATSLLLQLHPDPSVKLIKAMMWHDAAERWMGDLPSPVKRTYPLIRASYEQAENDVLETLGVPIDLNEEDAQWLRAIDALEFYLWTLDQKFAGNGFAENCWKDNVLYLNVANLPTEVRAFFNTYHAQQSPELVAL